MPMMGERGGNLVPFGKYRGQAVEVLFADQEYLKWLLAQAWFAQQYSQLHALVINHGVLPDDTPEHNALQLAFLDEGLCLQACRAWHAFAPAEGSGNIYGVPRALFEHYGFDVSIRYALERTGYPQRYWGNHWLFLELKPSLGDDYPSVLRKMFRTAGPDNPMGNMLVYEHWSSQMPASQVETLFARSGKLLISLDTLRTYPNHVEPYPTEVP